MLERTSPAATAQPGGEEPLHLTWLKPAGIVGLAIYNFVLRILTLGIHHFWGKTEVRKRIWSSTRLNGEPLEYTGTGGELFTGFLIVFGVVLLPVLLASFGAAIALGPESTSFKVFQFTLYASFLYLTGVAIYRAQRYRLARTCWRGIRASLVGSSWSYGWTYFWTLLLLPFTLGWIAPWRSTRLQRIVVNDMRFGNRPFHFSASSGPLYKSFALFWVLTALMVFATGTAIASAIFDHLGIAAEGEMPERLPPGKIMSLVALIYGGIFVAGLLYMVLSAWYRAATMRHFARHTHLDGLTFNSTVTARGLLWITITNYLMLFIGAIAATLVLSGVLTLVLAGLASLGIDPLGLGSQIATSVVTARLAVPATIIFLLSLGMLLPVAQARTSGYLVRRMTFDGNIDTAAIAAGAAQDIKRGEGLAQAFDIDAI